MAPVIDNNVEADKGGEVCEAVSTSFACTRSQKLQPPSRGRLRILLPFQASPSALKSGRLCDRKHVGRGIYLST
jgi:hypothetical protein